MTKSLPSKKIIVASAPEVSGFEANFQYNFYTPDESLNDTGLDLPDFIVHKSSETFDAKFIESIDFNRKIPRYIKFDWKPVATNNNTNDKRTTQRNIIQNNLNKIHNEQTFTTEEYTNLDFQDSGKDQRLSFFVIRALEEAQRSVNRSHSESPLDIAKLLNRHTPNTVQGTFLTDILLNLQRLGVTFVNKQNRQRVADSITKRIQNFKVRTQLNNRVIKKILSTATESTFGIFEDESEKMLEEAEQTQNQAISSKSASMLKEQDYDFEIYDYIGYRKIDAIDFDSTIQPVGYIIAKHEILPNGTMVQRDSIVIENPYTSTVVDYKIKYGSRYVYTIKSIVFLEIQSQDILSDEIIAVSFLISSQESRAVTITCEEKVAPPPPSDFNISWDYSNRAARVMWSLPPNSQRDIKYFQLFRRKNISEPFQLIKMYDFNDNLVALTNFFENPDPALIEKSKTPIGYFLDKEFTKDSKFIYAICAIDAHGFSSNYSIQLEISFDRLANKISKKLVSISGAPKAYPNMYLNQDTFVDTIRDSGHQRLKIVFNPEYLDVVDSNGHNLNLLKAKETDSYKLSIINLDLQSQKVITVNLSDKRTTEDKNIQEIIQNRINNKG